MENQIVIESPDGTFRAYISRPAKLPAPVVVVLQELFGVNADIRATCDELAAQGFIAIAPDLFWRLEPGYDAEHDHYTCPAGAKLTKAKRRADHSEDFDFYRHLSACFTCPLRSRCTPTKLRRIKRWENEDVLDRMQDRLDRMLDAMGIRRQTVEHPFGTLKAWMGATHFLTRTLDKVRTEMSLNVLAYNLKRMITIFGVGPLMAAIRT